MQGSFFVRVVLRDFHLGQKFPPLDVRMVLQLQHQVLVLQSHPFRWQEAVCWILREDGECYTWLLLFFFYFFFAFFLVSRYSWDCLHLKNTKIYYLCSYSRKAFAHVVSVSVNFTVTLLYLKQVTRSFLYMKFK